MCNPKSFCETLSGRIKMAANNNNNTIGAGLEVDPMQVVRIDEDSDDKLQAMFDMVLKPTENRKIPLQLPYRLRKLPDSFFKPPATGSKSPSVSHSRENSADSAFGSGTTTLCSPTGALTLNSVSRLQISHSRAHSSPASLQQTYAGLNAAAAAAQNAAGVAAAAAAAANAANNNNTSLNGSNTNVAAASAATGSSVSVGAGASAAVVAAAAAVAAAQQRQQVVASITPNHMKQRSYDVVSAIQLQEELGDLPPGWEQARTAEGQIYYLK